MKQLFTCLFFAAACGQAMAQISWTAPVTVTSGGTYGNQHPRVVLNGSGEACVLWGKAGDKAYFSKWNGSSFTMPVALNPTFNIFSASWAGPDLAAHGDTIYATMQRAPEMVDSHYVYVAHSYNGGATFSAPMRASNISPDWSRFPAITTAADGNPIVAFMKFDSGSMTNAKYVVARSTDWGGTFGADVLASNTNPVCDCCPAQLVASGSKVALLYRDEASNIRDTWAGVSTDGGMTFPSHMNVDNGAWMVMTCPSTGPDGFILGDSLYSVFRTNSSGAPRVYLSRSAVSTASFGARTSITGSIPGLSLQDYPRIANWGNAATVVYKQTISGAISIVSAFTNNIHTTTLDFDTVALSNNVVNADVVMGMGTVHVVWEDNTGKVMYRKGTYTMMPTELPTVSKEQISVYPNPATETFTVSMSGVSNVLGCYLSDVSGRRTELKPELKNGNAIFSLKGISKGSYYFVLVDDAGKNYYSKLVVE